MTLSAFLISDIFTFLLIFCRVGTALMFMPGFGESYVNARARLMFALGFSLVLTPSLQPSFPAPPDTIFGLANIMIAEMLVGAFFGAITRFLIAAISTGGMIIAFQSSLASAVVPDVAGTGGQGSSLGNFLAITALVLLFVTDLHHLLIGALHDSYRIFSVGHFPDVSDFAAQASRMMAESFLVAMQIAAPHIVMGLVVYLAAGIIAKLMPNLQVFFIIVAPQLLLSFFLLMLAFNSIMMWYMEYFKTSIARFIE